MFNWIKKLFKKPEAKNKENSKLASVNKGTLVKSNNYKSKQDESINPVDFYSNPGTYECTKKPSIKSTRPFDFNYIKTDKIQLTNNPWKDFADSYQKIMNKKEPPK